MTTTELSTRMLVDSPPELKAGGGVMSPSGELEARSEWEM